MMDCPRGVKRTILVQKQTAILFADKKTRRDGIDADVGRVVSAPCGPPAIG